MKWFLLSGIAPCLRMSGAGYRNIVKTAPPVKERLRAQA